MKWKQMGQMVPEKPGSSEGQGGRVVESESGFNNEGGIRVSTTGITGKDEIGLNCSGLISLAPLQTDEYERENGDRNWRS
jgi:hypothetical protein